MRLFALVLLFLIPAMAADVPVYVNAGSMLCGAIVRTGNLVQTWCWLAKPYTATTLGYNAIQRFPPEGGEIEASCEYQQNVALTTADVVAWKFKLTGTVVNYEVSANGGPARTGVMPMPTP